MTDDVRQRGLDMMQQVYGWHVKDAPGDHFAYTVDHLFADIWSRDGLSIRDRRLLLLGAMTAQGIFDMAEVQVRAALHNQEFTSDQLQEIAIFLCHYVGWPLGTKLDLMTRSVIADVKKKQD
ncbi:carboxymuconolactone decarboxylase family protein [Skermania sp. ID1734]|uniref:carboxymuconolactone decarboxylase family protein n=1 Tax=Skermania sp. ID1734 TaxID=2597516 RepID=UPI00117EEA7C|nr:carboxymuconolactone decarboxylase family protein [Skermania sp. ID1734]TSD95661.1 carboxymuconolactone decarboxylase family protein [Skermania sp. ID1734]